MHFSRHLLFLFSLVLFSLQTNFVHSEENASIARLAEHSMLLDGSSSHDLLTVVGERGHILTSTDGNNWKQAKVPSSTTLTGVYFYDDMHGWVVGHDAVILKTVDGGQSWKKVFYDPEGETPLFDVWFKDAKQGIAIGAYGLFLTTNNGGDSWDVSELNIITSEEDASAQEDSAESKAEDDDDFLDSYDLHLNSIALSPTQKLYIAAEAGRIYRSDDYGVSWVLLESPYVGSFFGVMPLKDNSVLVYGLRGHLYRSDDAGMTWQELETHTHEMLTNGLVTENGEVFITGLGGVILKSTDGGQTFSLIEQKHRNGHLAIIEGLNQELITIGEAGITPLQ